MWHILFVFNLVLYANVESEKLIVNIKQNGTDPNSSACSHSPAKLMDGKYAYIDFYAENIEQLKALNGCVSTSGKEVLGLTPTAEYLSDKKRYKMGFVNASIQGRWQCDVLEGALCILHIRVMSKDRASVAVNNNDLKTEQSKTEIYDDIGTYYYTENELVKVVCQSKYEGLMKFMVKGEPNLTRIVEGSLLTMFIKLRTEPDGKYIDCFHNKTGLVSIVRIMMQLRKTAQYNDPWQIEINHMPWQPRPDTIVYNYVSEEKLRVDCRGETTDQGYFMDYNNTRPVSIMCPKVDTYRKYGCTQIMFNEINTDGLQGLQSNNILFLYTYSAERNVIHYEYAENDSLNISWNVMIQADKSNEFTVHWKDNLITSFPVLNAKGTNEIKLAIPTISPRDEDDYTVIKFSLSTTDAVQSTRRQTLLVLRRKTYSESDGIQNYSGFYIAVGVGSVIIVIIFIMITLYIIRNKLKALKNESSDQNYSNINNEATTGPFPPQWDTYAETMAASATNADIQAMYAKPVPKSLRKGKLPNDTYSNIESNSTIEDLYSDIERYDYPSSNNIFGNECYTNVRGTKS